MNLAVPLCEHERQLALKWFSWVSELGPIEGHQLYLLPAYGMEFTDVRLLAEQAFPGAVIIIPDSEKIKSDWQADVPARSAAGPNSMFRTFAWHFYYAKLGPWFWLELDAIPLKAGFIDAIEAEYIRGGMPFMGAHVVIDKVPEHLTGNSVCPQNVPELAPTLIQHTNWIDSGKEYELAFDIAGAKEVLPKAHFTNLIQHRFRHPGFKTRAEVDALLDPNAVIFHSNKDGSLISFLKGEEPPQEEKRTERWENVPLEEAQTPLPISCPNGHHDIPEEKLTDQSLMRDTVAILKQLCRSPYHTNRVRKELKLQGVIK